MKATLARRSITVQCRFHTQCIAPGTDRLEDVKTDIPNSYTHFIIT